MSTELRYETEELKDKHFKSKPIQIENYQKTILINTLIQEKQIIIYADLCGVEKEDISIEVIGKTLRISAERKLKHSGGLHNDEIINGKIIKLIQLEQEVDSEKAKSKLENGLLIIELPKIIKNDAVIIKID